MTHRAQVCRIRRVLAACATTLGMLTVAPAAVASAATTASPLGWLRLANLSPGAPTFDIYLYPVGNTHARLVLRNIGYGMISGYEALRGLHGRHATSRQVRKLPARAVEHDFGGRGARVHDRQHGPFIGPAA